MVGEAKISPRPLIQISSGAQPMLYVSVKIAKQILEFVLKRPDFSVARLTAPPSAKGWHRTGPPQTLTPGCWTPQPPPEINSLLYE